MPLDRREWRRLVFRRLTPIFILNEVASALKDLLPLSWGKSGQQYGQQHAENCPSKQHKSNKWNTSFQDGYTCIRHTRRNTLKNRGGTLCDPYTPIFKGVGVYIYVPHLAQQWKGTMKIFHKKTKKELSFFVFLQKTNDGFFNEIVVTFIHFNGKEF